MLDKDAPGSHVGACCVLGRTDLIHVDGFGYVLERLLAEILFAQRELVPHLVPHESREADSAGIGQLLKGGRLC